MNIARALPAPLVQGVCTLALVSSALALTLAVQSQVTTTGYIFFYAAVVASSWYGGKWWGWAAVVLSTLSVAYFFLPPLHSFAVRRESWPIFVEFAASSAIIGWFSSWRKEAEAELMRARSNLQIKVDERTAELRHTNQQLVAEMAERKRAEDAYYEAQQELARVTRLSELGALAASISHEVNQPLAAVVTNADACAIWLASDRPNLEEARAAVDCIAREGTRASDVVRRIRAMFTKSAPERSCVDLNELIADSGALLQSQAIKDQVEFATELAPDLPPVMADPIQLQQVIVNLALNGIEAMRGISGKPRRLVIRSVLPSAGEVLISVSDSGAGIPDKDRKRIFDAFFTTKDQGMGMGLSISRSIIEAHGGRLWAGSNADGPGATLQFTLPAGCRAD